jgi:hypothetical protein
MGDLERDRLLARLPAGAVVAEIGVWQGDFSEQILHRCRPARLHLIDPWVFTTAFGKRWYGGLKAQNQHEMDAIYESVRGRFANCHEVQIHRSTSMSAAALFPDDYFDWVYIDGNHDYEFVLEDLGNFAPKIKRGGCLTGDDYGWDSPEEPGLFPVRQAVQEFAASSGLAVEVFDDQFVIQCS